MKEYKSEIEDILVSNRQLAVELQFDLRQHDKQELDKQESKKAREAAAAATAPRESGSSRAPSTWRPATRCPPPKTARGRRLRSVEGGSGPGGPRARSVRATKAAGRVPTRRCRRPRGAGPRLRRRRRRRRRRAAGPRLRRRRRRRRRRAERSRRGAGRDGREPRARFGGWTLRLEHRDGPVCPPRAAPHVYEWICPRETAGAAVAARPDPARAGSAVRLGGRGGSRRAAWEALPLCHRLTCQY